MEANQKSLEIDGELRTFDAEKTFGVIAEEIRTSLPNNRVLTDIVLDNRPIDLVEELEINEKALKTLGQIVLRSRQVDELFRESLTSAPRICEALQNDCAELEKFIDEEKFTEATDRLTDMSSLLEWLIQLVVGAQSLGTERIEDMHFSKGRVMDSCTRMQFQLVQLHFQLGNGNWTEFKKILSGDFRTELKTWEILFSELAVNWNPKLNSRAS
jgi:hypothetical protein